MLLTGTVENFLQTPKVFNGGKLFHDDKKNLAKPDARPAVRAGWAGGLAQKSRKTL